jgi:hypothetical protein
VADPTLTPLNVRKSPNGPILGALNNGILVVIMDRRGDWVKIVPHETEGKSGWVWLQYLDCTESKNNAATKAYVQEESSTVLQTLPAEAQKDIERVRASCREAGGALRTTSGDEGLIKFTVQGAQAVLVDELNFCDDGQCNHGINCATGFTHDVAIYIRSGKSWRKALSRSATELRVLTDNFAARFDAEYLDGDFFVDFTDETNEDLIELMKSRFVTIEFGSGNERLALYTADTGNDGKGDLKGALRDFIPSLAKAESWGSARIFGMNEMFGLCENYKSGNTVKR